ncbi:MAG: hypothetical protein WA705_06465 [Candidatus Ozemobacteraceae bacterium]
MKKGYFGLLLSILLMMSQLLFAQIQPPQSQRSTEPGSAPGGKAPTELKNQARIWDWDLERLKASEEGDWIQTFEVNNVAFNGDFGFEITRQNVTKKTDKIIEITTETSWPFVEASATVFPLDQPTSPIKSEGAWETTQKAYFHTKEFQCRVICNESKTRTQDGKWVGFYSKYWLSKDIPITGLFRSEDEAWTLLSDGGKGPVFSKGQKFLMGFGWGSTSKARKEKAAASLREKYMTKHLEYSGVAFEKLLHLPAAEEVNGKLIELFNQLEQKPNEK